MNITLNNEYLNARKLIVPAFEKINLVLVGCGGTGSWLAPHVVRFARLLVEKFNREVRVTFVDPDKVETKNIYRQNFCEAEVGQYKAEALALRYSLAWGIPIDAMTQHFNVNCVPMFRTPESLTVLIGCVDNTVARQEIERRAVEGSYRDEKVWWLDCGNKKTVGQVLLGTYRESEESPLLFDGLCGWLPLPSLQHPELVEPIADDFDDSAVEHDAMLSCAELAMQGSQSLSINTRMAAIAGEMLEKFLLTNDLEYYAVYIDQATGEKRKFITDQNIEYCLKTMFEYDDE